MFRRVRQPHLATIASIAALFGGADITSAQVPTYLPPGTQRVSDQGISDLTRLRTTLRTAQPDLRLGQNFSDLYKFQDTDGSQKYARVSGAVTAIFPQSEYADAPNGQVALIPAGTTFHIGKIKRFESLAPLPKSATFVPSLLSASTHATMLAPAKSETAMLTRSDAASNVTTFAPRAQERTAAQSVRSDQSTNSAPSVTSRDSSPLPARGMLSDESYRRKRVRELLTAAAVASAE